MSENNIEDSECCVSYQKTFPTLENTRVSIFPSCLLQMLRYLFKLVSFAFKRHFVQSQQAKKNVNIKTVQKNNNIYK